MTTRVIYLLRFEKLFKHAGHYMGSMVDLEQRLASHRKGNGARLMFWVAQAGISWQQARIWEGGRARERQLKAQGGHSRHCPICRPPRRPERCQS